MYNKDIYQLLEYGKFLKRKLIQLYFDLEMKIIKILIVLKKLLMI